MNTLLGIKKNMTSSYDIRGRRVGATVVELAPNYVTQVKTADSKDGYNAVQIATGTKKSVRKPQQGHMQKANAPQNLRFVREVRVENVEDITLGQIIGVKDVFAKGDVVKVTAVSKGKGFQGGVKRYGFAGGPKTHGQSDRHRAPGSIGQTTTPGRVYKGKHMAGHMGMDTVSILGLEVLAVDRKNNLMTIKGGIPGPVGGLVRIQKQGTTPGYTPESEEEENAEAEEVVVEESASSSEEAVAVVEETVAPSEEAVAVVEESGVPVSAETLVEEPEKEEPTEDVKEDTNA